MLTRRVWPVALLCIRLVNPANSAVVDPAVLDACPGYKAANIVTSGASITAELSLRGKECNVFGPDVKKLQLQADYESGTFTVNYGESNSVHGNCFPPNSHPDSCQNHRFVDSSL